MRETIGSSACGVTAAMLRGYQGALAPAKFIEPLVQARTVSMPNHEGKRLIVLPAKNKVARDPSSPAAWASGGGGGGSGGSGGGVSKGNARAGKLERPPSSATSSTSTTPSATPRAAWAVPGLHEAGQASHGTYTSWSPDSSAPTTPRNAPDDGREVDAAGGGCPAGHFLVNLFVTAIGEGEVLCDAPDKKAYERLGHVVSKVPKEQNTTVEVMRHGS